MSSEPPSQDNDTTEVGAPEPPTTPPPKAELPTENETSIRPSANLEHPALNGVIVDRRDAAMRNLDYKVPEETVDYFINSLLPGVHQTIDVDAVVKKLGEQGVIAAPNPENSDEAKRWADFNKDPVEYSSTRAPKGGTKHEDEVFKPLQWIYDAVISCATKGLQVPPNQTVAMRLLPRISPTSDREIKTKPDAIFVTKDAADRMSSASTNKKEKRPWWYDIAVSAEFKKANDPEDRDDVSDLA